MGGVRWWNVKHPTAYAGRLAQGLSPAAGRETLDLETRNIERVMLEARLQAGLEVAALSAVGRHEIAGLIADGLVDPAAAFRGKLVLTLKGRLLADAVVRRILPE
jgi:oxygen-independent coproporphyrinogen-3 oxidase